MPLDDHAPSTHLRLVADAPSAAADARTAAGQLDAQLYDGPDGDRHRALEDALFTAYARSDDDERAYMRMIDHPTRHCAIRADGVMTNQPVVVGYVRVAPLPPLRGELGFGLGARAVITRDSIHDIEDARWSLRRASAPAAVQERARTLG